MKKHPGYERIIDAYSFEKNQDYFIYNKIKYKKTKKMKSIYNAQVWLSIPIYVIFFYMAHKFNMPLLVLLGALLQVLSLFFLRNLFIEEALKNIIEDN